MKLLIFDIDGTLTNTNEIDHRAYFSAFKNITGIDAGTARWEDFVNFTDLSITQELYAQFFKREANSDEIEGIQKEMQLHFENAQQLEPHLLAEVPGAKTFFNELSQQPNYAVAIATGCWSFSAEYKLGLHQIDFNAFPHGHSNSNIARHDIVLDAVANSVKHYKTASFEKIIYFGDGVWDKKTCDLLHIPLIGIDLKQTGTLTGLGVRQVFRDYSDRAMLYRAIENL